MAGMLAAHFDKPQIPTATVPASNSLILLDSRYRSNSTEQPTDFVAHINTALEVRKTYYRQLYWNQPLYTHNLTNNLLLFELEGVVRPGNSYIFAVLARPWYGYTSFDGNPAGSVFLTPQGNSYGAGMEYALNHDVRNVKNLIKSPDQLGIVNPLPAYKAFWDYQGINFQYADIHFRYSSARGFCIYATKQNTTDEIGIRLLDCPYISNGHNIHGFGSFSVVEKKYLPTTTSFNNCVYATGIPSLLEDRFIIITSDTLAKDRRGKSYSSTSSSSFSDEIAVLPIDKNLTGIFHKNATGEDTTTLDSRFGVGPQDIHVTILDSQGRVIQCSNIMDNVFNDQSHFVNYPSEGATPWSPIDFALTTFGGSRATPTMMNYLMFGSANLWWPSAKIISAESYQSSFTFTYGPYNAKMLEEDVIHIITGVALTS